jgi:predicted nucleic acid-binding protein
MGRDAGAARRARSEVNVNHLWIAATAVANELPVYARDIDYLALVDIGGPSFIRV